MVRIIYKGELMVNSWLRRLTHAEPMVKGVNSW